MKQINGVWLPSAEYNLVEFLINKKTMVDGKGSYQYHKLKAALKYVRNWRTAIDVGAHCGLWSMQLVKQFDMVHAFEPVLEHQECFRKNVEGRYKLWNGALGNRIDMVKLHFTKTS